MLHPLPPISPFHFFHSTFPRSGPFRPLSTTTTYSLPGSFIPESGMKPSLFKKQTISSCFSTIRNALPSLPRPLQLERTSNRILYGSSQQSHVFITFSIGLELVQVFQGSIQPKFEPCRLRVVNWRTADLRSTVRDLG